jgi:hypothetical protein
LPTRRTSSSNASRSHNVINTAASSIELGLGPCRAGPARHSCASCRPVLRLLGTRGTSCRASMARQFFY